MKRLLLGLPIVVAGCLPMQVSVVSQPTAAVIDGASVSYNEDYLAVVRPVQALQNSAQDQAAARAAVGQHCAQQGLGYVDKSSSFNAADASWRFRGNCVLPDGTRLSQ